MLHIVSPVIESVPLSKITGLEVYLKLDNTQPTMTFKIRGIGQLCQKAVAEGCERFICSSGGNAGLAAAYAAKKLKKPCTICVPSTTPEFTRDRIALEGAEVVVHGDIWNETDEYAQQLAKQPGCTYVHPFDHPEIWDGHTSLVTELKDQLEERPDLIVTCCGGGGLLNGIVLGLQKVGWDTPVLVMETEGAESLNATVKAGKLVRIPGITSVAKTLGSTIVSEKTWELVQKHKVFSRVVPDRLAVDACFNFADDHNFLVEPSCGATLAAVYSGVVQQLVADGELSAVRRVLVVVCGGNGASLNQLQVWRQQVEEKEKGDA